MYLLEASVAFVLGLAVLAVFAATIALVPFKRSSH